jgi:type IV pilus assembly protein PilO
VTATRRYIVTGVIALVVVLLFFMVILKPKFSQISKVREEIATEQQEKQTLEIKLRQLRQSQRNQVETQAQLAELNRALPSVPDLPALIRQLQAVASNSGMDLVSIAPSPPTEVTDSTGVQTVNVNVQVTGGFFRLESFMTRLEDLPRVVEVTSISVSPQTDPATGLTTLSSTVTFKMYVVQANAKVSGPKVRTTPRSTASPAPASTTSTTPTPTPTATR